MRFKGRKVPHVPWELLLIATVAVIAIGMQLGFAGASSLGTLNTSAIGASGSVVAPCQTSGSIALTWGTKTFNAGVSPFYSSAQINASNLNSACNSKRYKLVVADSAGVSLATASGTLPGAGPTATLPLAPTVNLGNARQVTIVIYA